MASWIDRLAGRKANSAVDARERLKLVLIHDRTDLTPDAVEALKNELIQVISRYVDIDPTAVKIAVEQDGREQRLVADIPVRGSRRKRG